MWPAMQGVSLALPLTTCMAGGQFLDPRVQFLMHEI